MEWGMGERQGVELKMNIRWIGQSGYILSDGNTTVCIDPYLSDAVNRVAGRKRLVPCVISPENVCADAIICTHNHLDHLDSDAISLMKKERMTFYAPSDCAQTLRDAGVIRYVPFDRGTVVQVGDFTLEAVLAIHTVPAIGVVVSHTGQRLYFTGDTLYHEDLARIKCDILFVCINGKLGNMDVRDAARLTGEIGPCTAVPNHYGMFAGNTEDPERFAVQQRFLMEMDRIYEVKDKCLI